jgi:hypothetical protein
MLSPETATLTWSPSMPAQLSLDSAHSAVLCMDYQTGIITTYI